MQNPLQAFNAFIKLSRHHVPFFLFMTGASGAGKTFFAQLLEKYLDADCCSVAYFDSIGVPSLEDMVSQYGSGEKWQERMTHQWVERLKEQKKGMRLIVLEGQYNPQFVVDACTDQEIASYAIINLYADRAIRERRLLSKRNQPELATESMQIWAEFLKEKTTQVGGMVIDTSSGDAESFLLAVADIARKSIERIAKK